MPTLDSTNESDLHWFDPFRFRVLEAARMVNLSGESGPTTGRARYFIGRFGIFNKENQRYDLRVVGSSDYLNGVLNLGSVFRGSEYSVREAFWKHNVMILDKSGIYHLELTDAHGGVIVFRGKTAIVGPFGESKEYKEFDAASLVIVRGEILVVAGNSIDCFTCGDHYIRPSDEYKEKIREYNKGPNRMMDRNAIGILPILNVNMDVHLPHICSFMQDHLEVIDLQFFSSHFVDYDFE